MNSKQENCEAGDTCFLIHIDMLHEAPLCMGIAHDNGSSWTGGGVTYKNVYWTYDGGSSQLVRFDFEADHGPGSMDHTIAAVRRYTGLYLTRVADVPSHMQVRASPISLDLALAELGTARSVRLTTTMPQAAGDARCLHSTADPLHCTPSATHCHLFTPPATSARRRRSTPSHASYSSPTLAPTAWSS